MRGWKAATASRTARRWLAEHLQLEAAAELDEPPEQWPGAGEVGKERVGAGIGLAHDASSTVVAEEPVVLERFRLAADRRQRLGGELGELVGSIGRDAREGRADLKLLHGGSLSLSRARQLVADGVTFWLKRNRFDGSYRSLSCWRRRYVSGGYAALTWSSPASPVKFT